MRNFPSSARSALQLDVARVSSRERTRRAASKSSRRCSSAPAEPRRARSSPPASRRAPNSPCRCTVTTTAPRTAPATKPRGGGRIGIDSTKWLPTQREEVITAGRGQRLRKVSVDALTMTEGSLGNLIVINNIHTLKLFISTEYLATTLLRSS